VPAGLAAPVSGVSAVGMVSVTGNPSVGGVWVAARSFCLLAPENSGRQVAE